MNINNNINTTTKIITVVDIKQDFYFSRSSHDPWEPVIALHPVRMKIWLGKKVLPYKKLPRRLKAMNAYVV